MITPNLEFDELFVEDFLAEVDREELSADYVDWDEFKFDPNQPRAEKGVTEGGQWVDADAMTHNGTQWVDKNGKPVPTAIQDRLRQLVVPPGWRNVVLNPDPLAGMQVRGIDSKGRNVYKYSAEFAEARAAEKFQRLKAFNEVVPKVRDTALKDMANKSLSKQDRDTAAATYLITKTGFRIGDTGETQAKVKAYGATTLLSEHVRVTGQKVDFEFIGKKGVAIAHSISDPELAVYLKGVAGKGSRPLFDTDAPAVRSYFKGIAGEEFKVKDLRTWQGTSTALTAMKEFSRPTSETAFKKQRLAVAKKVAAVLGNTPTVALKAYIDPAVFAKWEPRK